jgi:hypothetical protein
MKTTNALFGSLAVTLTLVTQVQAQFDVVGDFSTIANPNGVWSYGWATNAESPFQLLATEVQYYSDLGWENGLSGVADSEMCSVVKNFAGSFVAGTFALNPDTLHLDTGEYAVMARFVAPKSNNYAVRGLFRLEDTDTQAHNLTIVVNGNKTNFSVVTSSGAYNSEYPFNLSMALSQGETLDFVVSSVNGNYNNLGTGLKATIGPLIAGLYNTGVNNDGTLATLGTEDSHYALVSVPSGSAGTAWVVPIQAPNWWSGATDANWLSPATGGALVDAGQYDYRLTFSMVDALGHPLDPATATITGNWAADDSAMLFLNGAWVANNTTGFAYLTPFTVSSGFCAGTNTLDFLVINGAIGPSQSGLLVSDLSGTAAFATASVTLIADPTNAGVVTGGGTFNIGSQVQISATPYDGWTFTEWNDGNTQNPRTITVPSGGAAYAASFTFVPTNARYSGLFYDTNGIAFQSSGFFSLTLTAKGTFTAKLLLAGETYPFSGSFSSDGSASNSVSVSKSNRLTILLGFDSGGLDILSGQVSGASWTANLTAEMARKESSSAEYTALLSQRTTPPGYGYLLITNHTGTVTLSGTLADGTSFSQAVPLSGPGDLPVYGNLYGGTGLLLGWLGLESGSPAGQLTWIKPASRSTALYTNGFTNLVVVQGSPWTNPLPHTAAIDLPSGQLDISGGSLVSALSFNVAVSNNNALVKLAGSPTNSLSGSINPKTGLLTITFGNGAGKATTAGKGAVLQSMNSGGGFFLGKTNAGSIRLQP